MGRNQSRLVTILPRLLEVGTVVLDIYAFSVNMVIFSGYMMLSQEQEIKVSCNFMSRKKRSYHPPKFSTNENFSRGDVMIFICNVNLRDHMIKRHATSNDKLLSCHVW